MSTNVTLKRKVSLIGAPTDIGASRIGARLGPDALRVAGISESLMKFDCEVIDHGNLYGPLNPQAAAINGYRHLDEVTAWNSLIYQSFSQELELNRLPILLGGDHSLAIGSISAAANYCLMQNKKLLVIWFDAHADFNTSQITPSGNIHGMPVACLCGFGPSQLTTLSGICPTVSTEQIRLIGIRSVDEEEKLFLHQNQLAVYDMRYIDEIGMRHTLELALEKCDASTHLHVSLDLDFLDPEIAPGVGTPVRGGPNYREAQLCMEMIADTGCLDSLDIVELNPVLDIRNCSAELAVDLVESLFGKSTLQRFQHG